METIEDLLAELLDLEGSGFHVRYEGDRLRPIDDFDERAWLSVIIGLGAIRQRAAEAEALAVQVWGERARLGNRQTGKTGSVPRVEGSDGS